MAGPDVRPPGSRTDPCRLSNALIQQEFPMYSEQKRWRHVRARAGIMAAPTHHVDGDDVGRSSTRWLFVPPRLPSPTTRHQEEEQDSHVFVGVKEESCRSRRSCLDVCYKVKREGDRCDDDKTRWVWLAGCCGVRCAVNGGPLSRFKGSGR